MYYNFDKKEAFLKTVLLFFVFLILILILTASFFFFKLRSIYLDISSGRQDLSLAMIYLNDSKFEEASKSARSSVDSFVLASDKISLLEKNIILRNLKFVDNNFKDFKYLAQTTEILSNSLQKAVSLIDDFNDVFPDIDTKSFLKLEDEDRHIFLKTFYESRPEMQGIKANISLSLVYLNKIKGNRFLSSYTSQINGFIRQLNIISERLDQVIALSGVIPSISGYPNSSFYLIVLQNNNELRPTGGFIGNYAIMELKLGAIQSLESYDIYHLDMPASLNPDFNISPPEAIKKYLNTDRWFMRDANWSPDWPTSAENILDLYKQEMRAVNRESELVDFSGVIAINPRIITDLLYIVGPIEIRGELYNKDNFIDVLQYEVEMAFREDGISEWDRKLIISEILEELKSRIFNLESYRMSEVLEALDQNIIRKNIMIYLKDDYSRDLLADLNWGGELKYSEMDYLMLVDANLAAFKTDRVMDKRIEYLLEQQEDNSFKARLRVYYKNNGWFDWQTTRYRSFTRLYVPEYSNLISIGGASADSLISSLEKDFLFPKSYFGGFISIEPGRELVLEFNYLLPENFNDKDYYYLKLQRQPGSNISKFEASFVFNKDIIEVETDSSFEIKESNKLYWTNNLDRDYDIRVSF